MTDIDIAELRRRLIAMEDKCSSIELRVEEYWRDTRAQGASLKGDVKDQDEKLERLVNETAGQSATLEEIRGNLCAHKDEQAQQLRAQGDKIDATSKAVETIGNDMQLVKGSVVRSKTSRRARFIFNCGVVIAVILVCLVILAIFFVVPEFKPLLKQFFEQLIRRMTAST